MIPCSPKYCTILLVFYRQKEWRRGQEERWVYSVWAHPVFPLLMMTPGPSRSAANRASWGMLPERTQTHTAGTWTLIPAVWRRSRPNTSQSLKVASQVHPRSLGWVTFSVHACNVERDLARRELILSMIGPRLQKMLYVFFLSKIAINKFVVKEFIIIKVL